MLGMGARARREGCGYVLLVPETLLTKICIVSSSEADAVEAMLLMLLERRMVDG